MTKREVLYKQFEEYIQNNNLTDSFIKKEVLRQCRDVIPERRYVGKDNYGNTIFFEEAEDNLRKRHYGKLDKPRHFNLLVSNGEKSVKITQRYLSLVQINFNEGYNLETLKEFIKNNSKHFNPLKDEKKYQKSYRLTAKEHELVKEFIRRVREYNKNLEEFNNGQ